MKMEVLNTRYELSFNIHSPSFQSPLNIGPMILFKFKEFFVAKEKNSEFECISKYISFLIVIFSILDNGVMTILIEFNCSFFLIIELSSKCIKNILYNKMTNLLVLLGISTYLYIKAYLD